MDRLANAADAGGEVPAGALPEHGQEPSRASWAERTETGTEGQCEPIGDRLLPEYLSFQADIQGDLEGRSHLEQNLLDPMAWIVTAPHPLLTAAQVNTQVEFDRTFRTIVREHGYRGKRVLYVSGLHIDISPQAGQRFPLTKFVPWAAFVQQPDGSHETWSRSNCWRDCGNSPARIPIRSTWKMPSAGWARPTEIKITLAG